MVFRNPQLLWLLLILPTLTLIWLWRGGRVQLAALILRLGAVALLVLSLAEPVIGSPPPPPQPTVILLDQSDSLGDDGKAALRARAAELARASTVNPTLIAFGGNLVHANLATDAESTTPFVLVNAPNPAATDLATALRAARELLPLGGRVLLLSDGVQTSGDALAEAQLMSEVGITVDIWPTVPALAAEVGIAAVSAPRTLRVGEEYPITIDVAYDDPTGNGGQGARLQLWEDERLLGDQQVNLMAGTEQFTFRHTASVPGVVRLRAEIVPEVDTFVINNSSAATALVAEPPLVVLVEGVSGVAAELRISLDRAGVQSEVIPAFALPSRLSDLDRYDGIVLVDVPANALSLDQMTSVREFVRSEGRGLVAIGGRNSFGLGSYKGTPLEEALPVEMDPPPRPERSDIAMLLIIDRSASMTAALGVSKFDMAKEAAILATESLQPSDRIGILSFDTGTLWVVNFQDVGEGASVAGIQERILNLPSGGGTDIEIALAAGLPELARQPSQNRHAVLLTDGRSFINNMASYQQLVETARASNITLSTIAIGYDADTELLDQLAQWGGGRYYFAESPEDIPRLTLLESEIARANPAVEGELRADLATPHPIVRDFAPSELPQLEGYVATTPRDNADVVLRSPEDDPLLATWQYGLGRAVAWTPSAGAPWANGWPQWEGYERFWAQVVRYTLPEPDSGPLQVRLSPREGGAQLQVDALRPGGEPLDLAVVNARIVLPDGSVRSVDIPQSAPGRYVQDLALSTPGGYAVSVVLLRDGELQQADIGYVQQVAEEYRLGSGAAARLRGEELLATIAVTTGGAVSQEPILTNDGEVAQVPIPTTELWPWLLGAALVLFVLDIAVRRGLFVRGWMWARAYSPQGWRVQGAACCALTVSCDDGGGCG
ncbi:VWA domain-containing protein [Candidatus Gracilibacteria bacterium]|nr:VWA domain-containing protein [Candidatus Gracilibacteria bacterium]